MLFKDIIENNVIIHCDTEEKSNKFLQECKNKGVVWKSGEPIKGYNYWNTFKSDTHYYISSNMRVSYGNLEDFLSETDEGYTIKYKIIDFEEFQKSILFEKLNEFTRRNFTEEEVYIFPITLCDNIVDRDNERFSANALEEMRSMFLGVTGIIDDHRECIAKIFHTEIITEDREIITDEDYTVLKAYAFMIRNADNADIIKQIESGEKKEVSISCCAEKHICSICETDKIKNSCDHIKGKYYNGKKCYITLNNITDVYEWAFVKKAEDKIDTDRTITSDVIISEIHKSNCETEILEYLQKWIIDTNNQLKNKCKKQDKTIQEMKKFTKILDDYDD